MEFFIWRWFFGKIISHEKRAGIIFCIFCNYLKWNIQSRIWIFFNWTVFRAFSHFQNNPDFNFTSWFHR